MRQVNEKVGLNFVFYNREKVKKKTEVAFFCPVVSLSCNFKLFSSFIVFCLCLRASRGESACMILGSFKGVSYRLLVFCLHFSDSHGISLSFCEFCPFLSLKTRKNQSNSAIYPLKVRLNMILILFSSF